MGATSGFISQLGKDVKERQQQHHAEGLEADISLRERKADELTQAMKNMQTRAALRPGDAGYLSPEELKFQLGEAQKQLTALYKPEEGAKLMERLKHATSSTATVPPIQIAPGVTAPGRQAPVTLRPGMTLADVLGAGGPAPEQPTMKTVGSPHRGEDGKWFVIQQDDRGNLSRKELQGYTEETRKQELIRQGYTDTEATKIMRIESGLESKAPASHKGYKYDKETDEAVDLDTGDRYPRSAVDATETPEWVRNIFAGAERVKKEKAGMETLKFNRRLQAQNHSLQLAIAKGDHTQANKIVNDSRKEVVSANERMETMDKNKADALNGNQQAMLSLVANHIGMTLGAQKGARITRAVWDEAMESAPWIDTKIAHWFHTDPETGDHIFDGFKTGVTLTPEQITQMVDLAHQKVDTLRDSLRDMRQEFKSDLEGKGSPKTAPATFPPSTAEPQLSDTEKQILERLK